MPLHRCTAKVNVDVLEIRLENANLPRYIEFRDTLPRNPQGRILKYQLRDEGKTPNTWDLEATDIKVAKR